MHNMERIKQLHDYFEKINCVYKDFSYEDQVIDNDVLCQTATVQPLPSSSNEIITKPDNNDNENAENDNDDDDDDEDDEDFDVNKKNDNDDCSGSDSEADSVDLEYQNGDDEYDDDGDDHDTTDKVAKKKKPPKSNLVQIDETKAKDLWQEFQAEIEQIEARKRQQAEPFDSDATRFRLRRYEFAGETFTIQESYSFREKELLKSFEKIERAQKKNFKHPERLEPPKRRIELPDVLTQMKKSKLSTLNKTKHDWDEYKRDKDIVDELHQHQKSKHSYVERQAFLERADHRQYENEKKIREHDRKIRLQKKYADVELAS